MFVQLQKISSLYNDKKGKPKLIKDSILSYISFDTLDIRSIEQITDKKGNVLQDKCVIYLQGRDTPIILNHSQDDIHYLKDYRDEIQGFKFYKDKKINEKRNKRKG